MTEQIFQRLSEFIQDELGIKMPLSKKTLLEGRLQKRLRVLRISSFEEYYDYLFSPAGVENELIHMIDLVTTNKTDFFREAKHFDYLLQTAVPDLVNLTGAGIKRDIVIWSAGCSTGEEPYTLAMALQEFADRCPALDFRYLIIATDISTRVLKIAESGIYSDERIAPIPGDLRKKYLLKSKDRDKKLIRIIPKLRAKIKFRRINFREEIFGFREPIDIVFCRNVIIYFDVQMQERLLNQFYQQMISGGYLFTGHSETLHGLNTPFVRVHPSVYRKPL